MQLESVMIRCGSPADVRRLCRAGGEVWQEHGQLTHAGGIVWRYVVVLVPAVVALQLGLIAAGSELQDMAGNPGVTHATRAIPPIPPIPPTHLHPRIARPRQRGQPGPGGDAA